MAATKFQLSPGAILPRDMNSVQWDKFARAQSSPDIRAGATGYDAGEGVWFGMDPVDGVVKMFIGDSAGNKITWDGSTLSINGNVVLGSGNFLRSGQTAYDTGTGFWIGNDSGTPKVSIGDSADKKFTWDGSELGVTGSINLTNTVSTFTPTWTGFASPPTGDLSYINFGAFAILFTTAARAALSTATGMTVTNLPAAIQPVHDVNLPCLVVDTSATINGAILILGGSATLTFLAPASVAGDGSVIATSAGFDGTSTFNKGIPSGWMVMYPLK